MSTRIVGIDLAADPKNTGVVELQLAGACAVVREPPGRATDDRLIDLARDAAKIGVDCPLGWPQPFVDAITDHQLLRPWAAPYREPMRFRRTDQVVRTAGSNPLSVSTDRLGVTALRCAHLQSRWAREVWSGKPSPRDGSGPLIEVYPAAALRAWRLPATGYKKASEIRYRLVEALSADLRPWLDASSIAERCIASDHVLDALVSALVAYATTTGATRLPTDSESALALVEGWIHVPLCDLKELGPASA